MESCNVGRSGLRIAPVALGTWQTFGVSLDRGAAKRLVDTALDHGVTLFDTADVYAGGEAERALGEALAEVPRARYVVCTKCFFPMSDAPNDRGLSRKHVTESVHASLRRLRLDHVDLVLAHRFDPRTPLEETVDVFDALVRAGKVLHWGVSRFTAAQLVETTLTARLRSCAEPVVHQTVYNLLQRGIEGETLGVATRMGLGTMAYSPLAQGVLTGKYLAGVPDGSRAADAAMRRTMWDMVASGDGRVAALARIAAEAGISLTDLALAFCLRAGPVVIGATRETHVTDAVAATRVKLDAGTLAAIDAALAPVQKEVPM